MCVAGRRGGVLRREGVLEKKLTTHLVLRHPRAGTKSEPANSETSQTPGPQSMGPISPHPSQSKEPDSPGMGLRDPYFGAPHR